MTAHPDVVVARSTGRAPGAVRGVLLVVEHFWVWYRRNWRATAVSSLVRRSSLEDVFLRLTGRTLVD